MLQRCNVFKSMKVITKVHVKFASRVSRTCVAKEAIESTKFYKN